MEGYIYRLFFYFFTKCSVYGEGNLILLRLSTEGVIAPAANLPLVSLTPVANYCRAVSVDTVGKFTSIVTADASDSGDDMVYVSTTLAMHL